VPTLARDSAVALSRCDSRTAGYWPSETANRSGLEAAAGEG